MQEMMGKALKVERSVIEKLKAERKRQGFTYDKLADMSGLHRTTISLIERGERHPSLLLIIKLAECLKINLKQLF